MDEEYKLMYKSLRDRLITSLNSKINTLLREKEQLDAADTNSLLLNPTQFSIANPASPGGPQTNRKTRVTRQRMDGDDLSNNLLSDPFLKRKRKALDDEGSPGPDGISTPAERAKARLLAQQTTPLYSVNSLFTDKELHMHSFNAHIAAAQFFNHSKRNGIRLHHQMSRRGSTSTSEDDSASSSSSQDIEKLSAPEMDRTASAQTFHVTRSTRTNAGNFPGGINLLSDLPDKHSTSALHNNTSSSSTRPSLAYAVLSNYNSKNGQAVPQTSGLSPEEVDDDLAKIEALAEEPAGVVDVKLMEELCADRNVGSQIQSQSQNRSRGSLAPDWPAYLDVPGVEAMAAVGVKNGGETAEGEG